MTAAIEADRFFEDFSVGDRFRSDPIEVREATILDFAQSYDPQPFHTDPDFANGTMFGGLIASGWQVLSETFAKSVEGGFLHGGGLATEGLEALRWSRPVRPGDAVHLEFTVVEMTADNLPTDRGRIVFDVNALNQNDEAVMSYSLRAVVRRRMA